MAGSSLDGTHGQAADEVALHDAMKSTIGNMMPMAAAAESDQ